MTDKAQAERSPFCECEECVDARKWIVEKTGVGGGARPLSFLIASHDYMATERDSAFARGRERGIEEAVRRWKETVRAIMRLARCDVGRETAALDRIYEIGYEALGEPVPVPTSPEYDALLASAASVAERPSDSSSAAAAETPEET